MRQIIFHEENEKLSHFIQWKISYILCVLENGHLGQLYFGKNVFMIKQIFLIWLRNVNAQWHRIYMSGIVLFHWNISDRNILFTVRQTTDIRQLNCCRKMAAGSVSSNMTVMRLLPETETLRIAGNLHRVRGGSADIAHLSERRFDWCKTGAFNIRFWWI